MVTRETTRDLLIKMLAKHWPRPDSDNVCICWDAFLVEEDLLAHVADHLAAEVNAAHVHTDLDTLAHDGVLHEERKIFWVPTGGRIVGNATPHKRYVSAWEDDSDGST